MGCVNDQHVDIAKQLSLDLDTILDSKAPHDNYIK